MADEFIDALLGWIRSAPLMSSINSFEFDHYTPLIVPVNNENLFFAQSSYLTDVSITLKELPDCVRLLNQLGSQLYSFTVRIVNVCVGNIDITSEIESVSSMF